MIRAFAFFRKELVEIVRQPRLVALMVLGPFLVLALFGLGYSGRPMLMHTTFVGPDGSIYEQVVDDYRDELSELIDAGDYLDDEAVALEALRKDETDLVVVFPEDALGDLRSGEHAVIKVVHDEIDPIRRTAVEVAARLAIQQVNATVLAAAAGQAQGALSPAAAIAEQVSAGAAALEADGSAGERSAELVREIDSHLGDLAEVATGSQVVLTRLSTGTAPTADAVETVENVDSGLVAARDRLVDLRQRLSDADLDDPAAVGLLATELRELADTFVTLTTLSPELLVQPFESETESTLAEAVTPTAYFSPASIALLLSHLALTLAALSLLRDRRTGLFEVLRAGPMSSVHILTGKFLAYLVVGGLVGAGLLAAGVFALDVPMQGSVVWLVPIVAGVVLASLGLGMVLSAASSTESQAVQWAMLTLLGGLFFSGFILSLDDLAYPIRLLSFALPVTYGIRALQDVMLRGVDPSVADIGGLAALSAVYLFVASTALRRALRPT